MQPIRVVLITILALLLAACTSPPKPTVDFAPDYNFGAVKTIGFYALSGETSGNNPTQITDFQRDRIDRALQRALEGKGYVFVNTTREADLLLTWHLNLLDKTDIKTYNNPSYGAYGGYGRYNRYAMYNCYNCMNQTEVKVTEYTEGTFIVDLIDPDQNASVWRSVIQSKIKEDTIRDQEALDAAAQRVMGSFPP